MQCSICGRGNVQWHNLSGFVPFTKCPFCGEKNAQVLIDNTEYCDCDKPGELFHSETGDGPFCEGCFDEKYPEANGEMNVNFG